MTKHGTAEPFLPQRSRSRGSVIRGFFLSIRQAQVIFIPEGSSTNVAITLPPQRSKKLQGHPPECDGQNAARACQ